MRRGEINEERLYTVKEAAKILGVSQRMVQTLIQHEVLQTHEWDGWQHAITGAALTREADRRRAMVDPRWVNQSTAAKILGVCGATVSKMIKDGRLHRLEVAPGVHRIERAAVDFMRDHEEVGS